ncbi:MAG: putative dipeptide chemoreceptor [Proteobacteria bacterium]|nr:putative dipeptide chemoreceptor [Pseudomonadota bacterium]
MTIAQRLIALIVASIACLLLLSGIAYFQMNKVYGAANYGNEKTVPSLLTLNKAIISYFQIQTQTLSHAVTNDPKIKLGIEKTLEDAIAQMEKDLKDYEALVSSDEDKRLLNAEKATLTAYLNVVDVIRAASRDYRSEDALTEVANGRPVSDKLTNELLAHMKFNDQLGKQEAAKAAAEKSTATVEALVVLLLALAALALIGVATLRRLTGRIAQANAVAARIAAGDLTSSTTHAQDANDEIGQLLKSLDKMRADLAQTIGEVVANAQSVAASADQLSTSAQQVATSSESQTASTAAAASAVEEMTVSIDHIGTNANDASQRAVEAGERAVQSVEHVDSAATQVAQVADQVEDTTRQMQTLSEQVEQIGSITVVIREVAEQTNLLALNAAIEAARAGEQGRGFAVVADEVRKLAERTTLSVKEISTVVSAIQDGASAVLGSMESSRSVVAGVVVAAAKASSAMGEISASTATVGQSIESISDALREQKASSADLARTVESIAQMSEENCAAVESVSGTAQQLVNLSDELKSSVARFQL